MPAIHKQVGARTIIEALPARTVRFIASDESIDRDGDTISLDGWDLSSYNKNPVVLYAHDPWSPPVGKATAIATDMFARKLLIDVYFPPVEELATNVKAPSEHALRIDAMYHMARLGLINTVSVGFNALEWKDSPTGRQFIRQELLEVSLVAVPANPNAVAVMRAANVDERVIKCASMERKYNRRLSEESQKFLREHMSKVSLVLEACNTLHKNLEELSAFIEEDGEGDMSPGHNPRDAPITNTDESLIEIVESASLLDAYKSEELEGVDIVFDALEEGH